MTPKRLAFILSGVVVLILGAILGGAYEINTMLSKQSVTLVGLKAKSQSLGQEQLSLNNTKKEIQKYASLEQIAQTVVPQDKNLAETLSEISDLASANNVALGSVTFPTSTLGNASTGTAVASSSAAAAPVPTKVNLNSPTNKLSQLLPVKTIPGVYELSITVSSGSYKVPYINLLSFIEALEKNRRTSQITSVSLTPDTKNPNVLTFTLVLEEYIKP